MTNALAMGWDWIKLWSRRQSHTSTVGEMTMSERHLVLTALAPEGHKQRFEHPLDDAVLQRGAEK